MGGLGEGDNPTWLADSCRVAVGRAYLEFLLQLEHPRKTVRVGSHLMPGILERRHIAGDAASRGEPGEQITRQWVSLRNKYHGIAA